MFFNKLREVIKTGSCMYLSTRTSPSCRYNIPIASVRNAKPRPRPIYPTNGKIHMFSDFPAKKPA